MQDLLRIFESGVEEVESSVEQEIRTGIQARRVRIGLNSRFADNKFLCEDLKAFLINMEAQLSLDPDWETTEGEIHKTNTHPPETGHAGRTVKEKLMLKDCMHIL